MSRDLGGLDDLDYELPPKPYLLESVPDELLIMQRSYLDPFDLGNWIRTSRGGIIAAVNPRFWTLLWDHITPNTRTGIKKPEKIMLESEWPRDGEPVDPALRGKKREDYMFLPTWRGFLAARGLPVPATDVEVDRMVINDRDLTAELETTYRKVYTKAWIKNQYPDRTFKLGDIHDKYKWLLQLWYLSDKGIEMHSAIKEPNTPRARLLVAYWNPSRGREEGYNGELARIGWDPQGNRANPGIPTFSATTYNAQTSQTEESPVPIINNSPNLPENLKYHPRPSDPEYVNHYALVVPNTVIQFTELTAYRNHDLMVHFKGQITSWDVIKVLLSPGDRSWATLWSNEEIPGQKTQFHLQHTPPQGQRDYFARYRDKMIESYRDMSISDPDILRKLCSELAVIINTLNSP